MKTFQQTFQSCQATTEAQILDQRIQSKQTASGTGTTSGKGNAQVTAPTTQRKSWFQGLGETVQQLVTKVQPQIQQQDQEMSSMKKSSSNYSFDDDLPEGKVVGGFKPKDQRKKLTPDELSALSEPSIKQLMLVLQTTPIVLGTGELEGVDRENVLSWRSRWQNVEDSKDDDLEDDNLLED